MNKKLIAEVMRHLGKRGGSVKSKAKAEASRKNGKLGGRPRKMKLSQPRIGSYGYEMLMQLFHEVNP